MAVLKNEKETCFFMKHLRLRRLLCFAAALALAIPALSLRAAATGIMNGTGISFTPLASYTREQSILTIVRLEKVA